MAPPAPEFRFGAVTFIPRERVLLRDGQPVALTPKAFDLLVYFAHHPGRLLTKDELMSAVWPDVVVEESNLAYHVFAIRKALGEVADGERFIETVPKQGYRFVAPLVTEPEVPPTETVLAEASRVPPATITPSRTGRAWWFGATGFLLGTLVVSGLWLAGRNTPGTNAPWHFREPPLNRLGLTNTSAGMWLFAPPSFQVSPDGRSLAATTSGEDGVIRVWVRKGNTLAPTPLLGTESLLQSPLFWSPDSRLIAYDATGSGMLRAVSIAGGAPQTICSLAATAVGGSWSRDDVIIVGNAGGGIMRCRVGGGTAAPVTRPEDGEIHIFPSFLSDGRHFVYLRVSRTTPELSGIYVTALDADPGAGRRLFTSGFAASYVRATDGGHGLLVFGRDGALFAQRFDERRLVVTGDAVQLATSIGSILDYPYFSVSETALVYREPEPPSQLTWFDRGGREAGRLGPAEQLAGLALSPDDDRVLVARHAPGNTVDQDLWLYDLADGDVRRQTTAPTLEFFPIWMSNDRFLYTPGGGERGIYQQAIGGERSLVFENDGWDVATSASSDGRLLFYSRWQDSQMRTDVWLRHPRSTRDGDVRIITGPGDQGQARLSHDSRLVAYVSNETGVNEVFVAELVDDAVTGAFTIRHARPVSQGGGFAPRWRADDQELFYLKADGSVMVVAFADSGLSIGPATLLFTVPGTLPEWGVSRNGQRFLFAVPTAPSASYDIVLNWQSILAK